jgi:hypothetical protein
MFIERCIVKNPLIDHVGCQLERGEKVRILVGNKACALEPKERGA